MGQFCPVEEDENENENNNPSRPNQPNQQNPSNQQNEQNQNPEQKEDQNSNQNENQNEEQNQNNNEVKEEKETVHPPSMVTRKELTSMSSSELNRFFNAVDKMMESKNGSGTSEFFRIAGYHGSPAPIYCEHGNENFPGWHRIYLLEFEKALQLADIELGFDGNVFLPYWDWTQNINNGLPKIIRERFTGWPSDFWPDNLRNSRTQNLIRASDNQISQQILAWDLRGQANDCLLNVQHWAHASTRFNASYPSIEEPHNDMHVIVGGNGGQMGGVAYAAFDICFWLHHCNVDRIYEKYLELEPDSKEEFENFQNNQNRDRFDEPLEPFTKKDGNKYYPKDTFNTNLLGYNYDILPNSPDFNQLRMAPTVVLFSQVKIAEFASKCYQIHCFIVNKKEENEFKEPQTMDDINYNSPNYAGGHGLFGRGMECKNCEDRPPMDIIIDITKLLINLNINRYDAKAKVYVLETTETAINLLKRSDTKLPEPIITGPLFDDKKSNLDVKDRENQSKDEVKALQKYLKKFGYYDDEIDGDYGPVTEQAVIDYQSATGDLEVDGIAGPKTKESIMTRKRCANIDPFAKNDVKDNDCNLENAEYKNKKILKYFIGRQPGYLKRNKVMECIKKACDEWDNACPLKFELVQNKENADITFRWKKFESKDDILRFDGPGGILGRAGNGFVEFDYAERWIIGLDDEKEDEKKLRSGQPKISLYYTAMHELGHALGLDHSQNSNNIMSPFYNPKIKKVILSEREKQRLKYIWDNSWFMEEVAENDK